MLKIADLNIERKNDGKKYELMISSGPRDRFITSIVFVGMTLMIWLSIGRDLFLMSLLLQLAITWYCYDVLEETVIMVIADDHLHVTRTKFGRLIGLFHISLNEIIGHEMTEKDLSMGDTKAQRLEVRLCNGTCYPLSKAFVLNEDVIEKLEKIGTEMDDFIAKMKGRDPEDLWG